MVCTNLIDFSEEDDNLISIPSRDSLEDLRVPLTFDNENIHLRCSEYLKPRRLSFLRKSLDWDTAFSTSQGLLNPQELCKVNKGFKSAESKRIPSATRKNVQTRRIPKVQSVGDSNSRSVNPQGSKGMPKTPINDQKINRLDGSSSKKMSPRNTKPTSSSPTSVLSPLSSTSSSPPRRFNNVISTTDFQSPINVVYQNFKAAKLNNATRSSSGLKKPSPRIGFFDEKPLHAFNLSPVSTRPKVKKMSASCTKAKTDSEIRGKSKNRLNIERKVQKDVNNGSVQMIKKQCHSEDVKSHVQCDSLEPRRPIICRKSLEWDSAFFTNVGLLNAEELHLVNSGFKRVEPDKPSSRTIKHTRRHTVASLEDDVFKDVNLGQRYKWSTV